MYFKKKLRKLLTRDGITQKDLAKCIGMSEAGFTTMITNDTVKVSTLQKIANYFEVSPAYFLDENEKMPSKQSNDFSKETVDFLQKQIDEKDHTIRKLLEHLGPVAAGKLKVYPPEERLQPMSGQLKVA